jgi:hypothetical protein
MHDMQHTECSIGCGSIEDAYSDGRNPQTSFVRRVCQRNILDPMAHGWPGGGKTTSAIVKSGPT